MNLLDDENSADNGSYARKWASLRAVVAELPHSDPGARASPGNALGLDLPDNSVDVVLISPPYIKVFNCHHNFRASIERPGWKPLVATRSEIGANRTFRQNRFLTETLATINAPAPPSARLQTASAASIAAASAVASPAAPSRETAPDPSLKTAVSWLTKAIRAAPKRNGDWVSIAVIGSHMRQTDPTFKPGQFGHGSLSKLVKACDAHSQQVVELREQAHNQREARLKGECSVTKHPSGSRR